MLNRSMESQAAPERSQDAPEEENKPLFSLRDFIDLPANNPPKVMNDHMSVHPKTFDFTEHPITGIDNNKPK